MSVNIRGEQMGAGMGHLRVNEKAVLFLEISIFLEKCGFMNSNHVEQAGPDAGKSR